MQETVNGGWTRDYVRLMLGVGNAVAARTGDGWMLDYYGPPEPKTSVDAEEPRSGEELVREARSLAEALESWDFEPGRMSYLEKHLRALETVARRLAGEVFSLREQAARCFDLDVGWVPEETFERAEALYDGALPGNGEVRKRLRRWRAGRCCPCGGR